jgi:hypothetical protein
MESRSVKGTPDSCSITSILHMNRTADFNNFDPGLLVVSPDSYVYFKPIQLLHNQSPAHPQDGR